mmetsp:Transcript_4267/g.12264  ORF Transcript_4267/g.12264 Transcript_4267/m.12264 type:complete len:211 (+) Transcript_4267:1001-1633(+)
MPRLLRPGAKGIVGLQRISVFARQDPHLYVGEIEQCRYLVFGQGRWSEHQHGGAFQGPRSLPGSPQSRGQLSRSIDRLQAEELRQDEATLDPRGVLPPFYGWSHRNVLQNLCPCPVVDHCPRSVLHRGREQNLFTAVLPQDPRAEPSNPSSAAMHGRSPSSSPECRLFPGRSVTETINYKVKGQPGRWEHTKQRRNYVSEENGFWSPVAS